MERLKAKTKKFRGVFMSKIINLSVNGKTVDEFCDENRRVRFNRDVI